MLNLSLDLVAVRLLDQDDLGVLNLGQVFVFLLAVFFLDCEDADRAVLGATEQSRVVVADAHVLHRQRMSLELRVLVLVFNKGVLENLDAAWLVLLLRTATHAPKDSPSVVHQHDLLEARLLLVPEHLFAHMVVSLLELPQAPQSVGRVDD